MNEKQFRVALLGFGTVGSSVARILKERSDLKEEICLTHVFNRSVEQHRVDWMPESVTWTEDIEDVFGAKPDVIVELTGAVAASEAWIKRALSQGVHVVTANKALLADKAPKLLDLARRRNATLLFEAAVGGGIPVIRGIREGLAGDKITSISGILNGTCNYVLSRMAETRESMDVALAEARRLGFAEVDPSADLDGDDAVAKVVLLAGVAFQRHIRLVDIRRQTIRSVATVDFDYARELGCTIRQISLVERHGDGVYARVGPALVPLVSAFGRNDGANNLIVTLGAYGNEAIFGGAGAGGNPTAVAVVSDLLALGCHGQGREEGEWLPGRIVSPPPQSYYVRFVVTDRHGIIANIASALSAKFINMDAVVQLPGYRKDRLPFAITLEACDGSALERAMARIRKENFHVEPPLALPILC